MKGEEGEEGKGERGREKAKEKRKEERGRKKEAGRRRKKRHMETGDNGLVKEGREKKGGVRKGD